MPRVFLALTAFLFLACAGVGAEEKPKETEKPKEGEKTKPEKKEIKGEVACAKCCFGQAECAAAIKVDGKVMLLEADESASEETKKCLKSFVCQEGAKKAKLTVVVKENEREKHWLYVGEIKLDK